MPDVTGVDCHAHVFVPSLKLAPGRRYEPSGEATLPDYLTMLASNGMSHGVLVQPSFLGTDNSYLVRALRSSQERLRGIAVVAPDTSDRALQDLQAAGCVGVRLNLIGQPDPDFGEPAWGPHLQRVADRGWQIEVHAEAARLPAILPRLLSTGAPLVIDHFGRPDPWTGAEDPGFRFLLAQGATERIWVKLSAAYRLGRDGAGEQIARQAVPLLRDAFGLDRLMWGSDWPHTQYEHVATPLAARRHLDEWLPDPADRHVVLCAVPARLFGFHEPKGRNGHAARHRA
jgi:predicted TIM-barrel fold metal-dependent hydrolase